MATPIFPTHILNPSSVRASIRSRVIDGGTSLSGEQDAISADGGGRWHIDYDGIVLNTPALQRLWEQWNSYLLGGARVCRVPLVSIRTAPRPMAGNRFLRPSQMHADDPSFPEVVKFGSPYIVASNVGSVATRGSQATIDIQHGAGIQGGEKFSANNGKNAYVIERVINKNGQTATCVISPPARTGMLDNDPLNFEWPTVQAKIVIGQDLSPMISSGFGTVSISFVEDFSNAS